MPLAGHAARVQLPVPLFPPVLAMPPDVGAVLPPRLELPPAVELPAAPPDPVSPPGVPEQAVTPTTTRLCTNLMNACSRRHAFECMPPRAAVIVPPMN